MRSDLLLAGTLRIGVIITALLLISGAQAADVEKLVAVCADCHGDGGASKENDIPIIGGYSTEFLRNNLGYYKTKERDCLETKFREGKNKGEKTDMCQIVKDLSDEDIEAIADYFSKKKFVRAVQNFDENLAMKGKKLHNKYCEKCHSEGGTLSEDDAGMPAGQWIPYLRQALKEFKDGKRPIPKKMKSRLEKVRGDDIEALVNYYGSFK